MYLPSNTDILAKQRSDAALHAAQSRARIDCTRGTSAMGRAALFNTLVSPSAVAQELGMGTALDTAKLQDQTEVSRATGILGTGGQISTDSGATVAQIIAGAPEVVSLNRGGGCTAPSYQPVPLGDMPRPGMPQRAPNIVQGPFGRMNYRGADATIPGTYASMPAPVLNPVGVSGLTGIAPPWADAGVLPNGGNPDMGVGSWLMDHPWLALLLAGGGIYALSRRNKAGR